MKESKFIELLNLYIDQQISPAEAGLLEDDIQHNSRHRRIYQQYCRMHRACTMVLENLGDRDEAAAEPPAGRVIPFAPRARRWRWGYAAAAVAAAACVALVALPGLRRSSVKAGGPGIAVQPPVGVAPFAPALAAATGPVRLDAPAYQDRGLPVQEFLASRLAPASAGDFAATVSFAVAPVAPEGARLTPLPLVNANASPPRPSIEQFVFQTSAAPADSPQIYRGRRATETDVERTAYQFKR